MYILSHVISSISGWIVLEKDVSITYQLYNNNFQIKTESATGSSDIVYFYLHSDGDTRWFTRINWKFIDWGYYIGACTPGSTLKFSVPPPAEEKKIWQVTATAEHLKIKCNAVEVLHFIYNNTYQDRCIDEVKGKTPAKVSFFKGDTASKLFISELFGKECDVCNTLCFSIFVHYVIYTSAFT